MPSISWKILYVVKDTPGALGEDYSQFKPNTLHVAFSGVEQEPIIIGNINIFIKDTGVCV